MALVEASDTDNLAQEPSCCCWKCYHIFQWRKGADDVLVSQEVSRVFMDFVGTTVGGFCSGSLSQLISSALPMSEVQCWSEFLHK